MQNLGELLQATSGMHVVAVPSGFARRYVSSATLNSPFSYKQRNSEGLPQNARLTAVHIMPRCRNEYGAQLILDIEVRF